MRHEITDYIDDVEHALTMVKNEVLDDEDEVITFVGIGRHQKHDIELVTNELIRKAEELKFAIVRAII